MSRRGGAEAGPGLRRGLSRIWIRLLAFNVLLVFIPAAGLLYLDTYERQLLDAQERSMVQQGRVLAAALSGRGGLEPAAAERLLVALNRRLEARLRVLDRQGRVIADSAALGPRQGPKSAGAAPGDPSPGETTAAALDPQERRESLLYRFGSGLFRLWRLVRPVELPPARPGLYSTGGDPTAPLTGPAVRQALAGRYGADVRVSGRADGAFPGESGEELRTVLHAAIPILGGVAGVDSAGRVVGAVLVSQSTERILAALADVRLTIFRVILASIVAAVVLSLLVATTIARPLTRLRDQARALVDRRGRLTGDFRGSAKSDEIGELTRALEELTGRLRHHLGATEAFAADVSHELKNPLASIRSAAEMLPAAEASEDRRRFEDIILREVARLESLLASVREIGSIDAQLEAEATEPVPLAALVEAVVEGYRLRDGRVPIELDLHPAPLLVEVSPERLAQVVENLMDNAVSFSPDGGAVSIRVQPATAAERPSARLVVEDEGPGIPPDKLERIFDRFFSDRSATPGERRRNQTGLGLAIVKAVAEGYGGTAWAENRGAASWADATEPRSAIAAAGTGTGARFFVTLPLSESRLRP